MTSLNVGSNGSLVSLRRSITYWPASLICRGTVTWDLNNVSLLEPKSITALRAWRALRDISSGARPFTMAALMDPVRPARMTGRRMTCSEVSFCPFPNRKWLISCCGSGTGMPRCCHKVWNSASVSRPMIDRPQPLSITPKPGELTSITGVCLSDCCCTGHTWRTLSRNICRGLRSIGTTVATKCSTKVSTTAAPDSVGRLWDEEPLPLPLLALGFYILWPSGQPGGTCCIGTSSSAPQSPLCRTVSGRLPHWTCGCVEALSALDAFRASSRPRLRPHHVHHILHRALVLDLWCLSHGRPRRLRSLVPEDQHQLCLRSRHLRRRPSWHLVSCAWKQWTLDSKIALLCQCFRAWGHHHCGPRRWPFAHRSIQNGAESAILSLPQETWCCIFVCSGQKAQWLWISRLSKSRHQMHEGWKPMSKSLTSHHWLPSVGSAHRAKRRSCPRPCPPGIRLGPCVPRIPALFQKAKCTHMLHEPFQVSLTLESATCFSPIRSIFYTLSHLHFHLRKS